MNLTEWHELAVSNDELIARLRRELSEALAAREALFSLVIEEEPSARETAA